MSATEKIRLALNRNLEKHKPLPGITFSQTESDRLTALYRKIREDIPGRHPTACKSRVLAILAEEGIVHSCFSHCGLIYNDATEASRHDLFKQIGDDLVCSGLPVYRFRYIAEYHTALGEHREIDDVIVVAEV